MKKLFISLIGFAVLASANAQPLQRLSFFKPSVSSIVVSNKLGFTNIVQGFGQASTNVAGFIFTNSAGNAVTSVAGSNDTINIAQDVFLWNDREGRPASFRGSAVTNSAVDLNGVQYLGDSFGSIVVKFHGGGLTVGSGSGLNATNACNFTFRPLWDGTNGSTVAGERFIFNLTPTTTGGAMTGQLMGTNFPSWRYPSLAGLRLDSITQTNLAAGTNQFVIDGIWFVGLKP